MGCAREKTSEPRETKLMYWSMTRATLFAARALTDAAASDSRRGRGSDDEKLRW